MSDTAPAPGIPQHLQPILDQMREVARALVPGGATESKCEVSAGGQAIASASRLSDDATASRRVLLFGCAEQLRTTDHRILDAELRRFQRNTHVPAGALIAFQWKDGTLQPYTGGLPLPDC